MVLECPIHGAMLESEFPHLPYWSSNLVRNRARHLASISSRCRPPSSLLRCTVDRRTRNIVPFHMNGTVAVASCLTCFFETGKLCALCHFWRVRWRAPIECVE